MKLLLGVLSVCVIASANTTNIESYTDVSCETNDGSTFSVTISKDTYIEDNQITEEYVEFTDPTGSATQIEKTLTGLNNHFKDSENKLSLKFSAKFFLPIALDHAEAGYYSETKSLEINKETMSGSYYSSDKSPGISKQEVDLELFNCNVDYRENVY
ncbi:MAG: hypothetical protein KC478_04475 [Bacteriovoracaceae bacterium]|nr:hypothetical protein [Bacteriovoracaceae bacterium]